VPGFADRLEAGWSEESRLFAVTYAAGFVFVSMFIA